jgi:asparagine N-glycosylation enzyme membrane subunit Stt3
VGSKAILGIVVSVVGSLLALAFNASLWPYVLAALIYSPALSILLSSTVFLTTIMFPDVDDPTQRQFRGLVMMLAIVIFGLPPTGAFLGIWALGMAPWTAAIAGSIICLAMSALACLVSGRLYESYNPSE